MNPYLKQFIIITIVFIIIMVYQEQQDKRHNRVRETTYEKYKLPLLVSSIVGLLLNLDILNLKPTVVCQQVPIKNQQIFTEYTNF